MKMTLFDDQVHGVELLRESLRTGHKRPMMMAPTGYGKTIIAAHIAESAHKKRRKVLFTVPRIELINQTVDKFYRNGITDVGVIQANHPMTDWSKPIQIASVATLQKRDLPDDIGLGMVDEAHMWFKLFNDMFATAPFPIVGLSATPWAKGLGAPGRYDDLVVPATIRELILKGRLATFKVFAPTHPDLKGVRTNSGDDPDYAEAQLAEVMSQNALIADVVNTWLRLGENRQTLCFGVNRAHAMHLKEAFVRAGVPAGFVDCDTPEDERADIRRRFIKRELRIVSNVDVLSIGVDLPVQCLILARPTRSKIRHVQTVGRGLRVEPGKRDCIILDHGDSHLRLGYVTDIYGELHDGKPRAEREAQEREPILPRECKNCSLLVPPATKVCPHCGFERKVIAKTVKTLDGELSEFDGMKLTAAQKRNNRNMSKADKAAFHGELKWYADYKGYKSGWASMKYRDRFGVWPNDPEIKYAEPREPSYDTDRWIRSQNIRWAKGKRKQQQQDLAAGDVS